MRGLLAAAPAGYTILTSIDTFMSRNFRRPLAAGHYARVAVAHHFAMFVPGALVTVALSRLAPDSASSAANRRQSTVGCDYESISAFP